MYWLLVIGLLALLPSMGIAGTGYEFAISARHVEQITVAAPMGGITTVPLETRRAWIYGPYDTAEQCTTRLGKVLRGDVRLIFKCQMADGFDSYEHRTR